MSRAHWLHSHGGCPDVKNGDSVFVSHEDGHTFATLRADAFYSVVKCPTCVANIRTRLVHVEHGHCNDFVTGDTLAPHAGFMGVMDSQDHKKCPACVAWIGAIEQRAAEQKSRPQLVHVDRGSACGNFVSGDYYAFSHSFTGITDSQHRKKCPACVEWLSASAPAEQKRRLHVLIAYGARCSHAMPGDRFMRAGSFSRAADTQDREKCPACVERLHALREGAPAAPPSTPATRCGYKDKAARCVEPTLPLSRFCAAHHKEWARVEHGTSLQDVAGKTLEDYLAMKPTILVDDMSEPP